MRKSNKVDKLGVLIVGVLLLVTLSLFYEKNIVLYDGECVKDSDCIITGCSGEVCSFEEVITPCIWKEEYACLQFTSCVCMDNVCKWEKTSEYLSCLEDIGQHEIIITEI